MKRKILALTLVLALALGLCLTGCGSNAAPLAGPDEVAVALFDLLMKNDASGAQKALGYESEEAVRADFVGDDGEELYEVIAEELIGEFEQMGVNVSAEDSQLLVDSMMAMMGKLELTAQVKEISEKDKKAVVTCTVTKLDINDAMESATEEVLSDPSVANDMDAMVSAIIHAMADVMKGAEASSEASDPFDVDFSLEIVETNSKPQWIWVPTDANAFGAAISQAAMNS